MTPLKAVLTAAIIAILILALGAGVFALWYDADSGAVDVAPSSGVGVVPPEEFVESVPDRPPLVVAPTSNSPVENAVVMDPALWGSDDSPWNNGGVIDTGPFIDADNDTGDYSSGPVSDVGDYLDPEAE